MSVLAEASAAVPLPLGDWQFWVVSAAAIFGAALIARPLLQKPSTPSCGGCGRSKTPAPTSARLTIGGEPPSKSATTAADLD